MSPAEFEARCRGIMSQAWEEILSGPNHICVPGARQGIIRLLCFIRLGGAARSGREGEFGEKDSL
ncbi:MAG: hypothetical protein GX492_07090 [Firmicutes bacterium]|nr:hypothetical protein [Bacillota bacterium]